MAAISSARQFFEQVLAGGSTFIEHLVMEKTTEEEWLDFKGCKQINDESVKKTWSEAVCGFANTEGGVLIWGVDARKDPTTEVDAACDLSPHDDPARLRSRLSQLHPEATDPPHPGVEIKEFHQSGTSGPGFVACYIPESQNKPLRAELAKNKPYMFRVGDSFRILSTSLLRSMFYPRSNAVLWASARPKWNTDGLENAQREVRDVEVHYEVLLGNSGQASAKDVFAIVSTNPENLAIQLPFPTKKTICENGHGIELLATLHPSAIHPLCTFTGRAPAEKATNAKGTTIIPAIESVTMSLQLFALDIPQTRIEIVLDDLDIRYKHEKRGRVLL